MNSYQRYMAMIRGEPVDHLPRVPILMHFAVRYAGVSYADFARDAQVLVDANRRLVSDFGFDQLDSMCDPWRETADFGAPLEYQADTIPRCEPPLADTKDLSKLARPDPLESERMKNAVRIVQGYKELAWQEYSITGWVEGPAAEASDLRGVAGFMVDLLDDEGFACELMDLCLDNAIRFARAQVAEGADTIGVGDSVCSQISPGLYERLVVPRQKQLFDAIHDAGGLVRLHICGDTNRIMPQIATLGVDILDCDWQVDMPEARQIVGPKVALAGNLDPVSAVMQSTPEEIRDSFRKIYRQVGRPYFITAGCEIPADTPHENLRALCEPIPA